MNIEIEKEEENLYYIKFKEIIENFKIDKKNPDFKDLKKLATGSKDPLQKKYDFIPISSKKKKCMYCYRYSTISSHSISHSQLDEFSLNTNVYRIINRNILIIFSALLRVIDGDKDIKADSVYFAKTANITASTFAGFCGSDHENHDSNLFHNIDGHNALTNKDNFIWEALYRIISWKICKYEVDVELYEMLHKLSKKYSFFIDFWSEILNVNKDIFVKGLYFKEQKNIIAQNILNLRNQLNLLKQLKEKNDINLIQNRFFLHIESIGKPDYMGMNYFCDHNQDRKNWFEKHKIKNNLACGAFYSKKQYYSFVISDIEDQYHITFPLLEFITPILLGYDSENTFVHPDKKEQIKDYLINFSEDKNINKSIL